MAFVTSTAGIIPELSQVITVNGVVDSTIWCNSVNLPTGLSPATASFYTPELVWQSNLNYYRDAYIVVQIVVGGWSGVVFCGYISADSKELTPDGNNASFSAVSITGFLNKVYVGDADHKPNLTYKMIEPATGKPTRVTIKSILQSIYSAMPSYYRQRVQLGNTTALGSSVDVPEPEITLRNVTYQAATEQLLGYYGNVIIIQRMTGTSTTLDFVRMGDPSNPTNTVRVAYLGENVTAGANVATIKYDTQSSGVVTRVTVYSDPPRYGITLDNYSTTPAAKAIVPDWDHTLESIVLGDPKLASSKSLGTRKGCEKVFKNFRLPACLNSYKKLKELPLEIIQQDGTLKAVSCQAFIWKKDLVDDESNPNRKVGVEVAEPVLETALKFECDKNQIIFNEPVVRVVSMDLVNGKPVVTWEPAPFEVSICVEDTQASYGTADGTVAAGIHYEFAQDGLAENIPLDGQGERYLTNYSHALGGQTWDFRYYNDITKQQTHCTSSVNLTPNALGMLSRIAHEQLANSCHRAVTASIEIPWFAPGYQVGNRLLITGDATYENEVFTITGIEYDFTDHGQKTMLSADNSKPKHQAKIKAAKQRPVDTSDQNTDQASYDYPTTNDAPDDNGDAMQSGDGPDPEAVDAADDAEFGNDSGDSADDGDGGDSEYGSDGGDSTDDGSLTPAEMQSYAANKPAPESLYSPQQQAAPDDGSLTPAENAAMQAYVGSRPTHRLGKELTSAQADTMGRIANGNTPEGITPAMEAEYRDRINNTGDYAPPTPQAVDAPNTSAPADEGALTPAEEAQMKSYTANKR